MKAMKIVSIGGGPAGLYFALLMKKRNPSHHITVIERNQPGDTFGFGVVFSDATIENLERADRESHDAIVRRFARWNDIVVHYRGRAIRSTGHGFSGLGRVALLEILERRCRELGVELVFGREVPGPSAVDADLIVGADGVNSAVRAALAHHFQPEIDVRPNKFTWLGTTFPFDAFTFYFKEAPEGLWRIHAYRYEEGRSTFIAECTETTWRRAGLDRADEDDTIRHLEAVFAPELAGHRLIKNRSIWRSFPTIRNRRWYHDNVVLMGDAVHTAHFSIGSGTKLAIEDAIALADALGREPTVGAALAAYEAERREAAESLQRAAQSSLEWFESTERYLGMEPRQFVFSLMTRSLRVTHENLRARDPELVAAVDAGFAEAAAARTGRPTPPTTPPVFTPYRLRGLVLDNRIVVSPMCQYSADDGVVGDWHLVHLGSRAVGGAGLVIAEMTAVTREGRISPGCAGMYEPEHVAAWKRIVDFVRAHSTAKIGLQLGHAGRKGSCTRPWEGDRPLTAAEGAWPVLSASPIPYDDGWPMPREMTPADMDRVLGEFVRATRWAEDAGFDLIELHMAHGYLLASFISPLTNRRRDAYGGSLEGRLRFPLEVTRAVRAAWPSARPLSVRFSACDWVPGGLTPAEAVATARALHEAGADVIDVSTGQTVAHARPRHGRLYQTPFSDRIRHEAGVPTMTVGAISSYEDMNTILAAGRADLVVLARGHLYDPYLARHAAHVMGVALPWPPQYEPVTRYTPRFRAPDAPRRAGE